MRSAPHRSRSPPARPARFSFSAAGLNPGFSPPLKTATIIAQLRDVTSTARITVTTPGSGSGGDFALNASRASLKLVATTTAKTGSHTFTITGTGGGASNVTTLSLEVKRK